MIGDSPRTLTDKIRRFWRHRWSASRRLAVRFDRAGFDRIEATIAAGEARHRAELRFAVEADLDLFQLLADVRARDRAMAVFSEQRLWDTEENCGVLIYLLWADQAVEIVSDRGVERLVSDSLWQRACERIVAGCRSDQPVQGVVDAIALINDELAERMPLPVAGDRDELPNAPIVL